MLNILAKENNTQYFLISFVDLFGVTRSKLVPTAAIAKMQEEGAGFAGFSTNFDMVPSDPDMQVYPDPETFTPLPWQPDVAWVTGDLYSAGKPIGQVPRNVLKKILAESEKLNYRMQSGVEAEFVVLNQAGTHVFDEYDIHAKPCYDQLAVMRQYDFIKEICDAMQSLGWKPYQNDHEDSRGQFEMNWQYADALTTADRHVFFKFMVKSIGEKYGVKTTFMPKPFGHLTGNGCHSHVSLWDKTGKKNLFEEANSDHGLSSLGYQFMGGILEHGDAICALTNPTVNSYKRLNAKITDSGATWSPNTITYGGNDRTHMVRIPGPGRFEFRLGDGAANPYLLQASILAAGLDGIANNRTPAAMESQMATGLPKNLFDALNNLENNAMLRQSLGEEFLNSYLKLRHREWNEYMTHVSDWERSYTLDC